MSEQLPPPPYFYVHPSWWQAPELREMILYHLEEGYLVLFSAVMITAPMPSPCKPVWVRGKGLI
jgi:hypothetical protein